MDRITLNATDREIVGKKVKHLRDDGFVPGHVYGNTKTPENVAVNGIDFTKVFSTVGETGLINLKIGDEKVRPVLIRGVQVDPVRGALLHIDFYQVNLLEKVQVPVPVELIGEQPESVHMGETVVLQPISEIQIEALPDDLIEKVVVDQSVLKQVDDALTVGQLNIDRSKISVLTPEEEVVIKLAPAITEEMKKLMEEQAAEAAAAAQALETPVEGETTEGGEPPVEAEGAGEGGEGIEEKAETAEDSKAQQDSAEEK